MRYAFLLCLLFIQIHLPSQLLIRNVNLLDVENKKILNGYDVLVTGDRISSIQKDKLYKLPAGTEIIDGSGKWLSPGFTDAHVHFFQSGSLYTRPDAIDLRKYQPHSKELKFVHDNMEWILHRYAATGITSVIDVGASFSFLQQRDSLTSNPVVPLVRMTRTTAYNLVAGTL